jgi:hypothetical protein
VAIVAEGRVRSSGRIEARPDALNIAAPTQMTQDTPQQRAAQITAEIATLGFCLPGTLSARYLRCGNPRCRYRDTDRDQRHGPYLYWTRKAAGKTASKLLSAEQAERYRPWLENGKRLRALVRELEALSIRAAQHAEGWGEK